MNKADRISNAEMAAVLSTAAELDGVDEIFPISAKTGKGLEPLVARLAELVPEGPFTFPPDQRSDLPSEVQLAELIREQVLRRTREELPHAVKVEMDEVAERDDGLIEVQAHVWAETDSQKAILIGYGGSRDRGDRHRRPQRARARARRPGLLDLQVRVRKGWRKDDGLLDRIGIE